MTREEAKALLLGYRPGIDAPEEDRALQQALEQARHDAELRGWLEQQQQFQETFRQSLRGIPAPSDLKARILQQRKTIEHPFWRRRSFLGAAAAAAVLLLVSSALWLQRPLEDRTFAGFQSRMVGFALREYRMDIETNDPAVVQAHLANGGSPANFPLPEGLQAVPLKGGASFTWKGHPVSMVCFDWQKKETLYLFVIEEENVAKPPQTAAARVSPFKGVTTAQWKSGDLVYLLVGKPEEEVLRQLTARAG